MQPWEWIIAGIGVLAVVVVLGAALWAVFDVIRADNLSQTPRTLWLLAIFAFPLIGPAAWLYAKSRTNSFGGPHRIGNMP